MPNGRDAQAVGHHAVEKCAAGTTNSIITLRRYMPTAYLIFGSQGAVIFVKIGETCGPKRLITQTTHVANRAAAQECTK